LIASCPGRIEVSEISRVRPDIVDEPVDVDGRGGSLGDGARGVHREQGEGGERAADEDSLHDDLLVRG
jgi:hypothetical protein